MSSKKTKHGKKIRGGKVIRTPKFPFSQFEKNLHLGVSNIFINHCLNRVMPLFFKGTWSSDRGVYSPNHHYSQVINLSPSNQPGTHFIALLSTQSSVYYFDSSALFHLPAPLKKGIDVMLNGKIKKKLIKIPPTPIQSSNSRFCGLFCIKFLLHCFILLYQKNSHKYFTQSNSITTKQATEEKKIRSTYQCYNFNKLSLNDRICIQQIKKLINKLK